MQLERKWTVWSQASATDTPTTERLAGTSIKWMCTRCGGDYAQMGAYKDGKLQPWSFIHGLCNFCRDYGNRFLVPGSLECMSLIGWKEIPLEILRYQLDIELAFLSHPHHPHNEGIS